MAYPPKALPHKRLIHKQHRSFEMIAAILPKSKHSESPFGSRLPFGHPVHTKACPGTLSDLGGEGYPNSLFLKFSWFLSPKLIIANSPL